MKKISAILLSGMLLLTVQSTFAASGEATSSYDKAVKEYDFENNSYNVSDEQLQKEQLDPDLLKEDKKVSFWQKVVNSSHFSSNTATKTWIPLNKDIQP